MVEKNLQLVLDKDSEFGELDKRMDDDRKQYLLDPYVMTNNDGQPTPEVINVTMNDAKVFADRCAAIMNGANMQPEVFGKDLNDKDTTLLEDFFADIYQSADEILANSMHCSLYGFNIENILVRGSIATRCLLREEGEQFIPDITPIDTRYFRYEVDSSGLVWGCPKTWRNRAQIQRDYSAEELGKVTLYGKKALVYDFWDDTVNQVYINKKLIKTVEHGLGYTPFVYQKSGTGSMLQDEGNLKYSGESIFASNRGLIPELHRAASIMQTLNQLSFEGPLVLNQQEPSDDKPDNPYGYRKVISLGLNEGYRALPINDVKNATRLFYAMLVGALQRGSLPNIDYGNLTFPLSAVAISRLTASRDAIFVPRLQSIAMFYRALSRMVVKQYVQGGYQVPLGGMGREREYSAADVDKKFGVAYHFYSVSPEQEIANYAIAQQASPFISGDTIRRDILKLKNPDGEIEKMRAEKAEKGDLAISLFRLGHSLIEEGKNDDSKFIEAEMVLQQLEMVLRQRAGGQPTGLAPAAGGAGGQPAPGDQNFPKPLVPMMAGGGGGTTTPTPEETMPPEEITNSDQRRAEVVRKQTEAQ